MRTVAVTSANVEAGIVCHDVRNPQQRNEVFVRKGSALSEEDVRALLDRGVTELHIAVPARDDVAEDEAARRLGAAVAGPGVGFGEAHFGQVSFRASQRGLLRVDRAVVDRVNTCDGVLLLTAEPERPVDSAMTLGVVKCAPLFLSETALTAIESLHLSALQVTAFQSLRVGLVAPRERLRGGAFERSQAALMDALAWYGSTLESVIGAALDKALLTALAPGGLLLGRARVAPYHAAREGLDS